LPLSGNVLMKDEDIQPYGCRGHGNLFPENDAAVVDPPTEGELRGALVIPAFQEFCLANNINLEGCDLKLRAEALELFNRFKPYYVVFHGYVVNYRVWSWDFDLVFETQSVEEFLADTATGTRALSKYRLWATTIVSTGVFIAVLALAAMVSKWIPLQFVLIVIFLPSLIIWQNLTPGRKQRQLSRKRRKMERQLSDFREKLATTAKDAKRNFK
jgi:hypothetical protein